MSKSSIFKKIVVVLIAVFLLFGCSSQNPQPVTDPSNNKQETESNIETSTEPEHNEVEEVGNFSILYLHFFRKCLYCKQCKVFTYKQIEKL